MEDSSKFDDLVKSHPKGSFSAKGEMKLFNIVNNVSKFPELANKPESQLKVPVNEDKI